MCERKSRSPVRRLFQDLGNTNNRADETIDEIIDRVTELKCSTFRETYQFDLRTMQPCSSESDLRMNSMTERQLRHCWSWEAVNARLVPRFYRPVMVQSRCLEDNTDQTSMLLPKTPLKSLQKQQVSPFVKLFFRTVRRARSADVVSGKAFSKDLVSPSPPMVRRGQRIGNSTISCPSKTTINFEQPSTGQNASKATA